MNRPYTRFITRALSRWVDLWNQSEPPLSLACVRILVAAVILVDLLAACTLGAVPALFAPPPHGFGWGALADDPPLLVRCFGPSVLTALAAWLLAVVSAVCVLLGFYFRLTSSVLVFAMLELMRFTPDGDAIDSIFRFVLPLLALSDAHATLSLDARRHRLRSSLEPLPQTILAWPRYLIVIQLLWVYFSAAHHRGKASWGLAGGFSAIGDVLGDPHFARFVPGTFAPIYPLTQLATLLTMAFEFSAPLFLVFDYYHRHHQNDGKFGLGPIVRRLHLRNLWLALGVSLHLGIAASMQLGIFPFGILALYPALIHPHELKRLFTRLLATRFPNLLRAIG
jgi:hypothetical protein